MLPRRLRVLAGGALLMLAVAVVGRWPSCRRSDATSPRASARRSKPPAEIRSADEVHAQAARSASAHWRSAPAPQERISRNPLSFAATPPWPAAARGRARGGAEPPAPAWRRRRAGAELIGHRRESPPRRRRPHRHHLGARRRHCFWSRKGRPLGRALQGRRRSAPTRSSSSDLLTGAVRRLALRSRASSTGSRATAMRSRRHLRHSATRASLTAAAARISGSAFASPASCRCRVHVTTPTAPASSRPSAKLAMLTPCRPRIVPDLADDARLILVRDHEQRAFERRFDSTPSSSDSRGLAGSNTVPSSQRSPSLVCTFTEMMLVKFAGPRAARLDDLDAPLRGDVAGVDDRDRRRQAAAAAGR